MKLQKLLSYTRQAVQDFGLIQNGDKIAVGLSGGKDSLTLLYALKALQRFFPRFYELHAIVIHLGYESFRTEPLNDFCARLEVPCHIVKTEIGKIVFDSRHEKSPCSLCSVLRKGALNELASQLGCTKVAYGHHKDDVIDTAMMALLYEGRFYSFAPYTELEGSGLKVIRPLIYVPEGAICNFAQENAFPICKNPCPADQKTNREKMKEIFAALDPFCPDIRQRVFTAVTHSDIPDWVLARSRKGL